MEDCRFFKCEKAAHMECHPVSWEECETCSSFEEIETVVGSPCGFCWNRRAKTLEEKKRCMNCTKWKERR